MKEKSTWHIKNHSFHLWFHYCQHSIQWSCVLTLSHLILSIWWCINYSPHRVRKWRSETFKLVPYHAVCKCQNLNVNPDLSQSKAHPASPKALLPPQFTLITGLQVFILPIKVLLKCHLLCKASSLLLTWDTWILNTSVHYSCLLYYYALVCVLST